MRSGWEYKKNGQVHEHDVIFLPDGVDAVSSFPLSKDPDATSCIDQEIREHIIYLCVHVCVAHSQGSAGASILLHHSLALYFTDCNKAYLAALALPSSVVVFVPAPHVRCL